MDPFNKAMVCLLILIISVVCKLKKKKQVCVLENYLLEIN